MTFDAPVEAVTFDLDGTLCRYRRSPGEVLAVAYERVGVDPIFPVEAYYDRFREFAARADGMADLRERCFAALAAERGRDPEIGRTVARAFAAERDHRAVEPLPGALAAVEELRADYALGVVTNGPADAQREKLAGAGLTEAFDVVVAADGDPPPKPAVEPFERALSALGTEPAATVHVGDGGADVAGARAAGIRSVLVGAADADVGTAPDRRLPSLRDLPGAIRPADP